MKRERLNIDTYYRKLAENETVLTILKANATMEAHAHAPYPAELSSVRNAFADFVQAIENGNYQQTFVMNSDEENARWEFWKQYDCYKSANHI